MNFIDGILRGVGIDESVAPAPYRAVITGGKFGYFENIKGIKSYRTDEIILYLKKGELCIRGNNLGIRKFCLSDILICGDILGLEVKV